MQRNILKQLYTQIENAYYLKLLMTTDFSDATNLVLAFKDENGNIKLDMSLFHLYE